VRIGVKPGQWGWSWPELVASWQEAERAGFDLVSCFDHATAAPAGLSTWNAPSLLVAMAGVTRRIGLAVDVLNTSLRHPFLLAGQLAVAQAASGGRLEIGLGAGSHHLARFDHDALGIAARRDRLARCLKLFPRLWRGETVDEPTLGLRAASLGPLAIASPPLIVGGLSDDVIEIAARSADGWNGVVANAAEFAVLAARVDEICARLGRERPLRKSAQVFVRDVELAAAAELVADLATAGADGVTFVLVEERGAEAVAGLAAAVL